MEDNMNNNGIAPPSCDICRCTCPCRQGIFPPGYKFTPNDEEVVAQYLKKKVMKDPLPFNDTMTRKIPDVDLYRQNPEIIAGGYLLGPGERDWYFFTPRNRKYPNGERPNRAAGNGYWKATGADKEIKSNDVIVGYRKALVFYVGKPPKGDKTNWIMHEFRFNAPARKRICSGDMRLDDWVLCRIYKKIESTTKPKSKAEKEAHVPEEQQSDDQAEVDENQIDQGENNSDENEQLIEPDDNAERFMTNNMEQQPQQQQSPPQQQQSPPQQQQSPPQQQYLPQPLDPYLICQTQPVPPFEGEESLANNALLINNNSDHLGQFDHGDQECYITTTTTTDEVNCTFQQQHHHQQQQQPTPPQMVPSVHVSHRSSYTPGMRYDPNLTPRGQELFRQYTMEYQPRDHELVRQEYPNRWQEQQQQQQQQQQLQYEQQQLQYQQQQLQYQQQQQQQQQLQYHHQQQLQYHQQQHHDEENEAKEESFQAYNADDKYPEDMIDFNCHFPKHIDQNNPPAGVYHNPPYDQDFGG